ncbi:hypothetical protein [Streptomyces sp. NPDC001340]
MSKHLLQKRVRWFTRIPISLLGVIVLLGPLGHYLIDSFSKTLNFPQEPSLLLVLAAMIVLYILERVIVIENELVRNPPLRVYPRKEEAYDALRIRIPAMKVKRIDFLECDGEVAVELIKEVMRRWPKAKIRLLLCDSESANRLNLSPFYNHASRMRATHGAIDLELQQQKESQGEGGEACTQPEVQTYKTDPSISAVIVNDKVVIASWYRIFPEEKTRTIRLKGRDSVAIYGEGALAQALLKMTQRQFAKLWPAERGKEKKFKLLRRVLQKSLGKVPVAVRRGRNFLLRKIKWFTRLLIVILGVAMALGFLGHNLIDAFSTRLGFPQEPSLLTILLLTVLVYLLERAIVVETDLLTKLPLRVDLKKEDIYAELGTNIGAAEVKRIDLLEFSGQTAVGLIKQVVRSWPRANIRLLLCDPDVAMNFDTDREFSHKDRLMATRDALDQEVEVERTSPDGATELDVRVYKIDPCMSAMIVNEKAVCVSWYRIFQDHGTGIIRLSGNDSVAVYGDGYRSNALISMAQKQFSSLWATADPIDRETGNGNPES